VTTRTLLLRHTAAALLVAASLVALPARAGVFDDDEARARIEQTNRNLGQIQRVLDERIAAIEAQLRSQGLVELFSQVEQLKADVARLRGQIEVLTYEQEQSQKRQRDLYVDLDSRLRKLEAAPGAIAAAPGSPAAAPVPGAPPGTIPPTAVPGAAPAPGTVTPPTVGAIAPRPNAAAPEVSSEQRAYDTAFDQFKSNNFAAAIAGFGAFVKTYPKSPLAPSAQYWIGNAYFAQKDYRSAIVAQRQLVAQYPDSQKVPEALLNIATSQFEMKDGATARLQRWLPRVPT